MNNKLQKVNKDFVKMVEELGQEKSFQLKGKLLHGALGVSTEAGEVLDFVKKYMFYGREINTSDLKAELGDLLFYVQMVIQYMGSSMEEILAINLAKLNTRYPNGYNHGDAKVRDKEAEKIAIKKVENKYGKRQRKS